MYESVPLVLSCHESVRAIHSGSVPTTTSGVRATANSSQWGMGMRDTDENADTAGRSGISRREMLRNLAIAGGVTTLASRSGIALAGSTTTGGSATPVRFALLGDWGNGDRNTIDVARQMTAVHDRTPLDMVVTAGDNIYPDGSASHFRNNFEQPFEPLLSRRVPFFACLGNHDVKAGREAQLKYPLFHMGGRNYYSHTAGGGMVEVFVLDSNAMDATQLTWLDAALRRSTAVWKVGVLHHPPFSSGKRHGSDTSIRADVHPLFKRHGVRVVFSGHDHIYQRVTLQDDIQYFVSGAGGKIRVGDVNKKDSLVAAAYDDDSHFMVLEADATAFRFQAINTSGQVVDAGTVSGRTAASSFLRRFASQAVNG